MAPIRTRRDLATLLERQMAAASARYGATPDDDVEARTALKTYLLQSHGRMRDDPAAALPELCTAAGLELRATEEPELVGISQGETQLWLDLSAPRFPRLYTTASAKEADRIHEALVAASAMLDCVWILPRRLESLAAEVGGTMVLFSLRHDRRPLRRDASTDPDGVDFVTLRFWAPSAAETLQRLRESRVLPGATSVHSARVRVGDEEAHAVAEVFHNGKITAVGTSFALHERIVRAVLDDHQELAATLEARAARGGRVVVPVTWTAPDLGFAVARMFSGADPFRAWGLPARTGDEVYRVHAVDVGVGHGVGVEVSRAGLTLELFPSTPAGVAVRLVSALQFHVNADVRADALAGEPLLLLEAGAARSGGAAVVVDERRPLGDVARVVLAEACGCWLRGATTLTPESLLAVVAPGAASTPALRELAARVMTEAAAFEWREWVRPVLSAEGVTQWRWQERPPMEPPARARELQKLNRAGQVLVTRLTGGILAPWLQLSLFGAAELVPPSSEG